MLKIVTAPNPVLLTPAKNVMTFDEPFQILIKDMDEALTAQTNPQGVGLAAPQIGIGQSIFVMKPTPKAKTEVFVNPEILKLIPNAEPNVAKKPNLKVKHSKTKKRKKHKLEGCLSIPKIWGPVERAYKVQLAYQDSTGKHHQKWFEGFKAVIIQHEVDHLKGILYTQRVLEQKNELFEEVGGKLKKLEY